MNKKGFTLVELMAIIIVLGIISLIVIPTVNDTLTKQKEKLYEKQVDTIEKAAASWASVNTNELPEAGESLCVELDLLISSGFLKNNDIKDPRNNEVMNGCVNITLDTFYNQYNYVYISSKMLLENKTYVSGEAVELGGYSWHVIGDDGENITLIMDFGLLGNNKMMSHCGSANNSSNNCSFNGTYYSYSWDKSMIREYLNNSLYPELFSRIENEIIPVEICTEPSTGTNEITYGGYLISEINEMGKSCQSDKIVTDRVRLISPSEYWNLSPIYSGTNEKYPNTSGITRLSASSANWLYSESLGFWWTMGSYYDSEDSTVRFANVINPNGALVANNSLYANGVRPVITVRKQ